MSASRTSSLQLAVSGPHVCQENCESMKQYKEYYGREQAATKCNGSYVATFAPAVATDVAINERNENLRKLFATKRKSKSHTYNNLPHATDVHVDVDSDDDDDVDVNVNVLPEKGQSRSQRNGHMANEARSQQTVSNYGNTAVAMAMAVPQSLQKTGNRIRRWSVNRCGNMETDKYVQQTTLANNTSQKLYMSNANNNDYYYHDDYDDDNDDDDDYNYNEDIVSPVGKHIVKSAISADVNIDLLATRNQQYCSSYELATLATDNIRLSKNKLLESEHCLPIIEPYVPRYVDDFEVLQEENVAEPHGFIGSCFDAVETCSPNDFFASRSEENPQSTTSQHQHAAYVDQWSLQRARQQQDQQESLNVNSMSELMKIRLERQTENSLKQKYQQKYLNKPVTENLQLYDDDINLNTQQHSGVQIKGDFDTNVR